MKPSSRETRLAIRRWLVMKLAYLMPRSKRKWVFGSYGSENNAKALFIWLNEHNNFGIKPIWVGNKQSVNEIRDLGYKAHTRYGLPGKLALLTSKVWLFTSYISDLRPYLHGNACLLNLWHGVGIKSIEHKITHGPLAEFYGNRSWVHRMNHHEKFLPPTLFLSTSPMMTRHFSECFRIAREQCVEAGYPRCEVLEMPVSQADAYVEKYYNGDFKALYASVKKYSRVYFYLPTWRDSGADFLGESGLDFPKVNEIMKEQNAVSIYKPHPNSPIDVSLSNLSNVVVMKPFMEFYPLLRLADVLITDYSSVYYDYVLRPGGHTIFFLPDYEKYLATDRDLAFPFDEYTIGTKVYNTPEFLSALADIPSQHSDSTLIKQKFWSSDRSNRFLVDEIASRIGLCEKNNK